MPSTRPVRAIGRVGHLPTRTEHSIPSFLDLGISASLTKRLDALGITDPLPIQTATVPHALAGHDVCGQAPTGSGKTVAYALPLVAQLGRRPKTGAPTGLVLVPTRELAEQVYAVIASLLGPEGRRVVAVYGGVGYADQRRALRRGVDIVVACPGRLEDLVARGDARLDGIRMVVLDEADRMADMGFLPPVRRLVDQTADDRQVLLFSATMGREVQAISRRYQHEPRRCVIEAAPADMDAVTHLFWRAERSERLAITARLIKRYGQAFVFCRTKRGADRVASQLRLAGVGAAAIHGDRSQSQRSRALASFSLGETQALIATDVVARGIHVDAIPCVVHFDPADDPETYIHRSGRTGRAGQVGTVVSLVPSDRHAETQTLLRDLGIRGTVESPFGEDATSKPHPPHGDVADSPSRRRSAARVHARQSARPSSRRRRPGAPASRGSA